MCGTTTLPKKLATPPPQSGDDGEGSGGGGVEGSGSGDSSNSGVVDPSEFILELSEEELLLIYAEMFNHVTFLLSHESINSVRPKLFQTIVTTTTTTTTTTENINRLVINSGLTKPVVVDVAQFGVSITGSAFHLCDCQVDVLMFKDLD